MAFRDRLPTAMGSILRAVAAGHVYGYRIMEATTLPSGTVYPALSKLERDGLIIFRWELPAEQFAYRPPRKCYELTDAGRAAVQQNCKQTLQDVEVG